MIISGGVVDLDFFGVSTITRLFSASKLNSGSTPAPKKLCPFVCVNLMMMIYTFVIDYSGVAIHLFCVHGAFFYLSAVQAEAKKGVMKMHQTKRSILFCRFSLLCY